MTDFPALLERLCRNEVEFILIGGMAAIAHGSARVTQDLDFVYSRSHQNLERLERALRDTRPYLRGAPPGLPFRFDAATLRNGLNFTLTCTLGDVDLFGEIPGGGAYEDLLAHTVAIELYGSSIRCLDLPTLIHVKRAAGRPRDLDAIGELVRILEERGDDPSKTK